MLSTCDLLLSVLVGLLTVLYLAFNVYRKRWSAIVSFIVILVAVGTLRGFTSMTHQMCCVCVLVAIVGSNVVALPQTSAATSQHSVESFANNDASDEVDDDAAADDDVSDDESDSTHHKKEKNKKKKNTDKKNNTHPKPAKPANRKEPTEEVDNFSTFMETYKSLTPDQIETMTTDTQDLISTQQALMTTVKSMTPVIAQGKEMMDTFKDYFGPSSSSELLKAFKPDK